MPYLGSSEPQSSRGNLGFSSSAIRGVLFVTSFTALLIWITASRIAPNYQYLGYVERNWNFLELVCGALCTVAIGILVGTRKLKPSSFAITFLSATVAVPVIWIPLGYGPLSSVALLNLQIITVLGFAILALLTHGDPRPLKFIRIELGAIVALVLCATISIFAILVFWFGLSPNLISLQEVYEYRDEYNEAIPPAGQYLTGALVNALLPVLLAAGIVRRSPALVLTALGGFIFAYSLTGFRSFLAGMLIMIAAAIVFRFLKWRPDGWFAIFSAAVLIGLIADWLMNTHEWTSILTRRAIATAGINTAYYIEHFTANPTYFLRHSVFSVFGDSPYSMPPARLIGSLYYSTEPNANANFLADGIANFGWAGAVGAAVFLGLILRLFDRMTAHLPIELPVIAMVMVLVSLSNSAVVTVLTTHGAAVAALLISSISVARRGHSDGYSSDQAVPGLAHFGRLK